MGIGKKLEHRGQENEEGRLTLLESAKKKNQSIPSKVTNVPPPLD